MDPLFPPSAGEGRAAAGADRAAAPVTALRSDVLAVGADLAAQTADRFGGTWLAAETRTDGARPSRRAARCPPSGAVDRGAEAVRAVSHLGTGRHPHPRPRRAARHARAELLPKAEAHLLAEAGQFGPRSCLVSAGRCWRSWPPISPTSMSIALLLAEERAARATRLCSGPAATAPPTCTPGFPTWSPTGCGPTSTPTPHPGGCPGLRRRPAPAGAPPGEAFCALLEHLPSHGPPATRQHRHPGPRHDRLDTLRSNCRTPALPRPRPATYHRRRGQATGLHVRDHSRRLGREEPDPRPGPLHPAVQGASPDRAGPARPALPGRGLRHPCSLVRGPPRKDPWSTRGRTDLADGLLLCRFHHHRAHDPGYTLTHLPNGDHRYHRRC